MRLTVVGCSGSFAGPDSAASCYLLEGEQDGRTWRVLLDLGSGALGTLHRFVDPLTVDAVLFTHLHPDHYFDISGLYVMWKYHPDGPAAAIPVWGPQGVAGQCARAYGLRKDPGMAAEFDFHEYDDEPIRLGPFTINACESCTRSPPTASGSRPTGTSSSTPATPVPARSSSTSPTGADLLLCEAAFVESGDNPTDLHLTGKQAGVAAAEAGARRLVLTHIPPWHDPDVPLAEAREAYDGRLDVAVTGSTYTLG